MKSSNMSPPSFQICFIILIFQICDLMFAKIQWLFHNIPSRSKGLKLCQLNLHPANLFWDQWTVEKQIRYWGYGIWITSLLLKLASTETSFYLLALFWKTLVIAQLLHYVLPVTETCFFFGVSVIHYEFLVKIYDWLLIISAMKVGYNGPDSLNTFWYRKYCSLVSVYEQTKTLSNVIARQFHWRHCWKRL